MRKKSDKRENMLRIVSENLAFLRRQKYPGRGGSKKCAESLGWRQQQWSPWEKGLRLPNNDSLARIAEHFGVSVRYLETDNMELHRGEEDAPVKATPDSEPENMKTNVAQSVEKQILNLTNFKAILKVELSVVGVEIIS